MLNRHRIVQYLFHDMTNTLGDKWNDLVHTLIKFPAAFSVPPSLIKLTHAFWLLDNGDFEEAMVMLLDPLVLLVLDVRSIQYMETGINLIKLIFSF